MNLAIVVLADPFDEGFLAALLPALVGAGRRDDILDLMSTEQEGAADVEGQILRFEGIQTERGC